MEVSPNALRKETVETLKAVNEALERSQERPTAEARASLLLAKATCINTLTLLREQGKR
jgi:hypothetical protein